MTTTARLRALVTLAEVGSVRAAAERLVVSESAVSAAVAALAREVGVPLVEREGRGLRLTAPGAAYAGYARQILGLHEEALSAARGNLDPETGRIRVVSVTTAGEHIVPEVLATFRAAHPGVELAVDVTTNEEVWSRLAAHEADLAIGGRPPDELDGVVRAVMRNELVVVASPALAEGQPEAHQPGRATWLMREPGSGTRATCEALLSAMQLDPPRLTLGSNGAVIAGAVAGLGVTLVSRSAVRTQLQTGALVELPTPGTPLHRPWHAVTTRAATPSTLLLVEHLLADRPAGEHWRRPRASSSPGGSSARGR